MLVDISVADIEKVVQVLCTFRLHVGCLLSSNLLSQKTTHPLLIHVSGFLIEITLDSLQI